MEYREPFMEIIAFGARDIVCVSTLIGNDEGDGDSGSIKDMFF